MPQESDICDNVTYSIYVDNPPICALGHTWCPECMEVRDCPDYQPSTVVTAEEIKKVTGMETMG